MDNYDPRNCENPDNNVRDIFERNNIRDILVEKRPIREENIIFPLNAYQDIFHIPTTTKIRNGEVCDGKWLVLFFVVHARVHYRKIGIKIGDISVIG
jgi:hypothetical protein